jgi:hypothetical protein
MLPRIPWSFLGILNYGAFANWDVSVESRLRSASTTPPLAKPEEWARTADASQALWLALLLPKNSEQNLVRQTTPGALRVAGQWPSRQ